MIAVEGPAVSRFSDLIGARPQERALAGCVYGTPPIGGE
jgi:hypothetical protein